MTNKVQLISYVNRMSAGISGLTSLLQSKLEGCFGGVHLLPFYNSINGDDAGFDPIDHLRVDPTIGNWADVKALSRSHTVMADLIVNHMSSDSPQFQDVLQNGKGSQYWGLFLKDTDVFPGGPTEEDLEAIYRPRPGRPFTKIPVPEIPECQFWTTFGAKQIDINVETPAGKDYLQSILKIFSDNGVDVIRLDAAGYAIKRPDTSCFMIDETYTFIEELTAQAAALNMEVLVEIHSHYQNQVAVAKQVSWVYDFALPPLILHTLYTKSAKALKQWLAISPRNCFTVLDTHDGIGIIDVAGSQTQSGLLTDTEVDALVEEIHVRSNDESRQASGYSASNLDIYQINSTYYDALAKSDRAYLIARAIQFFSPGTPQVYYMGLLAERNDMKLLEETGVGRDINRHYFDDEEVTQALQRPVVKSLMNLQKLRNTAAAFNGEFELLSTADHIIGMAWSSSDGNNIALTVNLNEMTADIDHIEGAVTQQYCIRDAGFETL